MVGGTVINVVRLPYCKWVQALDTTYGQDTCAVRIKEEWPTKIAVGDAIWWQGDSAYFTPKGRSWEQDIRRERIGCSHSNIPNDVMKAINFREGNALQILE